MNKNRIIKVTSTAAAAAVVSALSAKTVIDVKNNSFCPVCTIKKLSKKLSTPKTSDIKYENNAALTPPMGWSSWNLFATQINENLIKEIALAVEKSGLKDAGYKYINIDDCWQASHRDKNGRLMYDRKSFPGGIRALSDFMNEHGLKLGIYSSNGTLTCEDYPGSLGHERIDAETFAEWGIEFFKYDFCHNKPYNSSSPKIAFVEISDKNGQIIKSLAPKELSLQGSARVAEDPDTCNNPSGSYLAGLDNDNGNAFFSFFAPYSGEYVLTMTVLKETGKDRFLMVKTGNDEYHVISFASKSKVNGCRKLQISINAEKGENSILLYNPVVSRSSSAMCQYKLMGQELIRANDLINNGKRPIVYSICEWGLNRPYKWGKAAGNLWRTTPDIKPNWLSVMAIYEHNVKLWKYSSPGSWNDPDMLEVGNGKLTIEENKSHFSLWCMMNAPLILGNDIRCFLDSDGKVDENNQILPILKNKKLISINQDALGVQARRIKAGLIDLLAKPLEDGRAAVCVFNKTSSDQEYTLSINDLSDCSFLNLQKKDDYHIVDAWDETENDDNILKCSVPSHGVKVFIIS